MDPRPPSGPGGARATGSTARYEPPAAYFAWPISPAKTWDQEFQYTDGRSDGRYANTWKVGAGVEPIDTVAGRFYTLRVERWGGPRRLETYWYNPRVRYWVRLEDYLRGYRGGAGGDPVVGDAVTVGVAGRRRGRRDPGRPDGDGWGVAPGAGRPAIAAHRGGASLWPENSLTAFRGALGLGVDLVECDVHQTRDGEVLVVHDPTLERTTTGRGAVRDVAWAELAAVTVRGTSGERVPRLADVLALLRPAPVGLLLEIKHDPADAALSRHRGASPGARPGRGCSPTGRRSWRSTGPSSSGSARSPRRSG